MRFLLIVTPVEDVWKVTLYDQTDEPAGEPIMGFHNKHLAVAMARAEVEMRLRGEAYEDRATEVEVTR